jgi:hypothetical protein
MNKRPWLYASVASIALVGCATTTESTRLTEQECRGNCKVDISITGNCDFGVPDILKVKLPHGIKKITWEITSPDYIFAANGIVIKNENPAGVLKRPHLSSNGKWFRLDNDHQAPGNFEYGINVIKTGDDPKICTKDPFIVNE